MARDVPRDECLFGDALERLRELPDECVQAICTSPPYYGLRDYGRDGQIGLEPTLAEYIERLVRVFREARRVLRSDGTLWLNLGDSYNGSGGAGGDYSPGGIREGQPKYPGRRIDGLKAKDLIGVPWRVSFALQADGWWLRSDIIWSKPNPMPEPATDRPARAHEFLFLFSKSPRYFYDAEAASRGSLRNRSVWTVPTKGFPGAHFAVWPVALVSRMILASTKPGDVVLDCFLGSGTTAEAAQGLDRRWIGIELNEDYRDLIEKRTAQLSLFGGKTKQ